MPRPRKKQLPKIQAGKESIGKRLSKIRKARGLTQTQIAQNIGIEQYLVSDYETGRLHLSDDMIIRFAKALKTSADTILGIDKNDRINSVQSLRLVRRLKRIEQLPPSKQKTILQSIDMMLDSK